MNRLMRPFGRFLIVAQAILASGTAETAAQDAISSFEQAERRLLQIGLIVSGDYRGRIDGIWGKGSQASFAEFRDRRGLMQEAAIAQLARMAFRFIDEQELDFRHTERGPVEFIGPPGSFESTEIAAQFGCDSDGVFRSSRTMVVFCESSREGMEHWHWVDRQHAKGSASIYLDDRADRRVTASHNDSGRFYSWSERTGNSQDVYREWINLVVYELPGIDPAVFDIVAGSMSLDESTSLELPEHGILRRLIGSGTAVPETPDVAGIDPTTPGPIEREGVSDSLIEESDTSGPLSLKVKNDDG